VGDDSKPKLVMIHGYGGSGALLYRLFRHLKAHF
jgi:pimeloyl-ACP methyl ester carboxylesterase